MALFYDDALVTRGSTQGLISNSPLFNGIAQSLFFPALPAPGANLVALSGLTVSGTATTHSARILLLTDNPSDSFTTGYTVTALTSRGHVVTTGQADLGSTSGTLDALWSGGTYDVIATNRIASGATAVQDWIKAKFNAGVPIMLGMEDGETGAVTDAASVAGLLSSPNGTTQKTLTLTNAHAITAGLASPMTVHGDFLYGATVDTGTPAGVILGTSENGGAWLTAVDVGRSLRTTGTAKARAVFVGFMHGSGNYDYDAVTILGRAASWLLTPLYGSITLASTSALTYSGIGVYQGAAALHATSGMTLAPKLTEFAHATLASTSALFTTPQVNAAATLSSTSGLVANATVVAGPVQAAATLSSTSGLTANGTVPASDVAEVVMSATSTLVADSAAGQPGTLAIPFALGTSPITVDFSVAVNTLTDPPAVAGDDLSTDLWYEWIPTTDQTLTFVWNGTFAVGMEAYLGPATSGLDGTAVSLLGSSQLFSTATATVPVVSSDPGAMRAALFGPNRSGCAWASGAWLGAEFSQGRYEGFESFRSRPLDLITTYGVPDALLDTWTITNWNWSPARLAYGVHLAVHGDSNFTLEAVASGAQDATFLGIFNNLKNLGRGDSILRIGWEANLVDWAWWANASNYATYVAAFRRVAFLALGVSSSFLIAWGTALGDSLSGGSNRLDTWLCYPGDDVVHIVEFDTYDAWSTKATNESEWQANIVRPGSGPGLADFEEFCRAHNKGLGVGEWGCHSTQGNGDNAFYVARFIQWFSQVADILVYESTFSDADPYLGNSLYSPVQLANASAAYVAGYAGLSSSGTGGTVSGGGAIVVGETMGPLSVDVTAGNIYYLRVHPMLEGEAGTGQLTFSAVDRAGSGLLYTSPLATVQSVPGAITTGVFNATEFGAIQFYVDDVLMHTQAADETGQILMATIPLGVMGVGSHMLGVLDTESGQAFNTPFTVTGISGQPAGTDVDGAPGITPPNDPVIKWVFKDPAPGGETYTVPVNPSSMTSPHVNRVFTIDHTSDPHGQPIIFEGRPGAAEWSIEGTVLTQGHQDALERFQALERRIWVVDHYKRAWLCTVESLDWAEVRSVQGPALRRYKSKLLVYSGPVNL